MKIANAGRVMFYHRTDPDTARRILREGFTASSTDTYELSLQPTTALRGSAVLRIAVPAQVAVTVLNGPSQSLMGAPREYFVLGQFLSACNVSIVGAARLAYAPG